MKHLLLPHNQELARDFLKIAISEAERFGVRPENVTPVPTVPDEFKKWLDAAVTIAGLSGLRDFEIIPTWPNMPNDFFKDYPQLTVGSLRGLSEAIEASGQPTCEPWVKLSEKRPEITGRYLVALSDPDDIGWNVVHPWQAFWNGECFEDCDPVEDGQPVTHWMPMPAMPAGYDS